MRRDDIIARLKAAEPALRARGIRRAAIFGSIARGADGPESDIDILVEFEPGSEGSIYEYMKNLKDYISSLFDGPVDVVDHAALKPASARSGGSRHHLCLLKRNAARSAKCCATSNWRSYLRAIATTRV